MDEGFSRLKTSNEKHEGELVGAGQSTVPRAHRRSIKDLLVMNAAMTISKVNDHLFIGPVCSITVEELKRLNITCIINLCSSSIHIQEDSIQCISLPLEDSVHENIYDYFEEISDKIRKIYDDGGKTLVCCIAGISRSASFCLAYLMKHQHMKLRDAFFHLKNQRKLVHPNNGFFEQLIDYECKLFGESSVKMIPIKCVDAEEIIIPDVFQETSKGFIWLKSIKNKLKLKKF